jgi:hypothetical protein
LAFPERIDRVIKAEITGELNSYGFFKKIFSVQKGCTLAAQYCGVKQPGANVGTLAKSPADFFHPLPVQVKIYSPWI